MVDIWKICDGVNHCHSLNETVWRIVESQEITATRKLVDTAEEQIVLEDMIESSKPILSQDELKYHPLLYTPFRCPPLKYGSRFGKKTEPSLWYGSLERNAVLSEKAFYQLNFLRASEEVYDIVQVPFTVFSTQVKANRGIRLEENPFKKYKDIISSPISYDESQQLGAAMRTANIEAFSYFSARNIHQAINIALFTPKAFSKKTPNHASFQSWNCIVTKNIVEFVRSSSMDTESVFFPIENYMINNALPFPAN